METCQPEVLHQGDLGQLTGLGWQAHTKALLCKMTSLGFSQKR